VGLILTNFTHVNVQIDVYVEVVNRYIFKPLLKDFGNPKADRIILKLILKEQGDRVRTECLKLVQDKVEWRNLVNYLRGKKIWVIFRVAARFLPSQTRLFQCACYTRYSSVHKTD
jgi:hypothetical protein